MLEYIGDMYIIYIYPEYIYIYKEQDTLFTLHALKLAGSVNLILCIHGLSFYTDNIPEHIKLIAEKDEIKIPFTFAAVPLAEKITVKKTSK